MQALGIVKKLIQNKKTIATAESCTGGLLGGAITEIEGSSKCYSYGIISYGNEAKSHILQVQEDVLRENGAVSWQTAVAMAQGVKKLASSDAGIAITGIAGPGGGTEEKPIGLVYVGLCFGAKSYWRKFNFAGSRRQIREQTVNASLAMLLEHMKLEWDI